MHILHTGYDKKTEKFAEIEKCALELKAALQNCQ